MPEPRAFKLRQAEHRPNNYTEGLPKIDKTRATAVLVRQSKTGADTAQGESRETQLGLQDYATLLYEDDVILAQVKKDRKSHVELYDEGAGVSGQKRIDQREELDRLYQDMHKGLIGTIVIAREDRLFRNKHMDQVGAFTKLAEEKKIKVIVPPISSAASEERTRIYDFTNYRDLIAFQDKMREAYGYIEGHVKYMNQVKQNKADKGGYDGRVLPPGFMLKGPKKEREIVIYEPWAKEMRKLALRARALSWDMGKLVREVAAKAYLFPEIPEEDAERYMFKTKLYHIPGVGYKPRDPSTLRDWFTNIMLIGWWQPHRSKPDTIVDHHDSILDYTLFAEGYAALTGYTLEGEPIERNRSITRLKQIREEPLPLLFHGKLLAKSPRPEFNSYITPDISGDKAYYVGIYNRPADLKRDKFLHLPAESFDSIVISRLKELKNADKNIQKNVKTALEEIYGQQESDFVSIHDQLKGIELQLLENAKKRMKTPSDDPMYKMLEDERDDLMRTQAALAAKKARLGILDSGEDIEKLNKLLGNFDKVWAEFSFEEKQLAFNLLINRIEIEVVSKHWLRLTIDWLDAINHRLDIAYIWKAGASRAGTFTEEEHTLIRQYYRDAPQIELLKLLPQRSWAGIQSEAEEMGIRRKPGATMPGEVICKGAGYNDFCPQLDGQYLFRDYATTLHYINHAYKRTSRKDNPLYAFWVAPAEGEDLVAGFTQENLTGNVSVLPDPVTDCPTRSCPASRAGMASF